MSGFQQPLTHAGLACKLLEPSAQTQFLILVPWDSQPLPQDIAAIGGVSISQAHHWRDAAVSGVQGRHLQVLGALGLLLSPEGLAGLGTEQGLGLG